MDKEAISGSDAEKRLYNLIWKRTIASQMSSAKLEKTIITINAGDSGEKFTATGEVIKFDGFLKVYMESTDDENTDEDTKGLLPAVSAGEKLGLDQCEARQRWTQKPPRYSEASLVRRLEELGIGRPSTYAPTISTIQQRGYVVKEDRPGEERKYKYISYRNGKLEEAEKTEIAGAERNKLFPTDIGMVVNDFLVKYFPDIVSYDFTAKVEKEFDDIAVGKLEWDAAIDEFYKPFHDKVEHTLENSEKSTGERILGKDPETGKTVLVRIGRFGPMAQLGETPEDGEGEKPKFASLQRGQHIETITLEEALELFRLPRNLGEFEGKQVTIGIGRFGPYIRHDNKFVSLKKGEDDPYTIDLETAIERIKEKREADLKKIIKVFDEDPDMKLLNGRWGPYISYKGKNYRIPKTVDAEKLTLEECLEYVEKGSKGTKSTKAKKSTAARKTTTKKTTAKKTTAKKSTKKK
jgi:DNA topoisomerase-1